MLWALLAFTIFALICWFPGTQRAGLGVRVARWINGGGGLNHLNNLPGCLDFQCWFLVHWEPAN